MSHSDAAIPSTNDDSRASKRRQILAAAAELFAQQGYDGTSIGAVAEAAKVQKSLV